MRVMGSQAQRVWSILKQQASRRLLLRCSWQRTHLDEGGCERQRGRAALLHPKGNVEARTVDLQHLCVHVHCRGHAFGGCLAKEAKGSRRQICL